MSGVVTTARVRLEVEVDLHGSWTANCSVEQVWEQAGKAAVQHLGEVLATLWGQAFRRRRIVFESSALRS